MRRGTKTRSYSWWLSKKRRVQKKYVLFLGDYYSPKEAKDLVRWLNKR